MRRGNRASSRPSAGFRVAETIRGQFERDLERFSEIPDPARRVSKVHRLKQGVLYYKNQLGTLWVDSFCDCAGDIVKVGLDEIAGVRPVASVAA